MKRLLVIAGPTASGKTALGIEVAKQLNGEVISGDSMQVYRGLDIGTGKVKPAEMQGVPHHLLDILAPTEPFAVADFVRLVDKVAAEIAGRGRLPILVGGTGLYLRATLYPYDFSAPGADASLRARLDQLSAEELHARVAQVDPETAERLHPNDRRRLIRALEVYEKTGRPISAAPPAESQQPRYDYLMVGLTWQRQRLYQRIEARVDAMLAEGWLAETERLIAEGLRPGHTAWQAIGYRELVLYLRGQLTWAEAVRLIKRNTRRLAKRQLSWFRAQPGLVWLDGSQPLADLTAAVLAEVAGKWPELLEALS